MSGRDDIDTHLLKWRVREDREFAVRVVKEGFIKLALIALAVGLFLYVI